MKSYYLTPGPSELYFTVPDHIQIALATDVCAISHRSTKFQDIFKHTVSNIKALLNIPDHFHVVFTGSANEIWERLIQNCVDESVFHLVNGSFSKRFYETSLELQKKPTYLEVPFGKGFDDVAKIAIPTQTEMICVTHNETSSGVSMPLADIYTIRKMHPDKLLVVDAVSSLPYPDFDYSQIDSVFFSVQKGFGLPAGLGVWIFNDRCAQKALDLQKAGKSIGTYHKIPELLEKASKNQTPETPNVLGIYLLGKVCEDMLNTGILKIRQATDYKAALLYNRLAEHYGLKPAVENPAHRSQTVIVAQITDGRTSEEVINQYKPHGFILGKGYGKAKDTQIRIANFPTFSKELFEKLVDIL